MIVPNLYSPCCDQAVEQSKPYDTGSTYRCILCDRRYTLPQPPKLGRTNR